MPVATGLLDRGSLGEVLIPSPRPTSTYSGGVATCSASTRVSRWIGTVQVTPTTVKLSALLTYLQNGLQWIAVHLEKLNRLSLLFPWTRVRFGVTLLVRRSIGLPASTNCQEVSLSHVKAPS